MYGLPTDTIRKEFRTRMVPANGLNPIYNEEPFLFRKVVLPDLAVLRFGVYDENGKLLGQRILPLDGLQAGYRHISLRTEANFPMALPMLFCNIELKIYVPDGLGGLMDALSDPRAFMSANKQKDDKMKELGIEESENSKSANTGGSKAPQEEENVKRGGIISFNSTLNSIILMMGWIIISEEMKFEPVTLESLRADKAFAKATKKYQKDTETMVKRQQKEKLTVQKNQVTAIEKIVKGRK